MATVKERLKKSFDELAREGELLLTYEALNRMARMVPQNVPVKYSSDPKRNETLSKTHKKLKDAHKNFAAGYQNWYSKALIVINQIMPDRYDEFVGCYKNFKRRKEVLSDFDYTISDYLTGISMSNWDEPKRYILYESQFRFQLTVFKSCLGRLDSILSDIQSVLQANLFDSELDAAKDLSKNGHLRAAGALAGVTLERHFATVASNHAINISKKNPTISDFNEAFKGAGIYDLPTYRRILFLGDIRNLSTHLKDREPTKEEIEDMIVGTDKILKMVF